MGSLSLMLAGLLATQFNTLFLVLPELMLFAAGFFAAHSVASSWGGTGRGEPEARPLHFTCFSTNSAQA